jgi:hypothetical protein
MACGVSKCMCCWKMGGCLVLGQRRYTEWVWIYDLRYGNGFHNASSTRDSVIWHFADRHCIFWWPIVHVPPGIKPSFTIKQNARGVDFSSTHRLEVPFHRIHSVCSSYLIFHSTMIFMFPVQNYSPSQIRGTKSKITSKCNRTRFSLPILCINCTIINQISLYSVLKMASDSSLSSVSVWKKPPHNWRVSLFRGIQRSDFRCDTNFETSPKSSVGSKPANALCVQHKWPNRKWLAIVVTNIMALYSCRQTSKSLQTCHRTLNQTQDLPD